MMVMQISLRASSRWRALHQSTTFHRSMSIGRMLDMGGMPSASNDQSLIRTLNASKNSKLKAVAFDFKVLTTSFDKTEVKKENVDLTTPEQGKMAPVQPDLEQIEQVASLLNVRVDTGRNRTENRKKELPKAQPHEDVRAKYAAKLKGGLAGIELAKSQIEDTLKGGDASGHLAARKIAMQQAATSSSSKWMALTGTGKILSYLTHRSIRIALLPNLKLNDRSIREEQQESMQELSRQLKDVIVDSVVRFDKEEDSLSLALQKGVLDELDLNPNSVLVVTDQDDYLKAARDLGMITCRIQPKNSRRGNVTAHYTTPSIPEVQEVVNEINGISFNSVLNR